jgi:hypothetical protein
MRRSESPAGVLPIVLAVDEITAEEHDEDIRLIKRIESLPHEVGWLLIYVGVLGFILPGVVGFPLILAGAAVVTPGGPKRIARWMGRKPPRFVHASMRQIGRLLDDMDRRYPPIPKRAPRVDAP